MLQAIEGIIDQDGNLKTIEKITLPKSRRVIIMILNEEPSEEDVNLALLSESSLSRDWERPEEDQAWLHLDQLPSL